MSITPQFSSKITNLDTNVTTLSGVSFATSTKQDTINTSLGTINTSVGSSNTKLDTLNTTLTSTTMNALAYGYDGSSNQKIKVNEQGIVAVREMNIPYAENVFKTLDAQPTSSQVSPNPCYVHKIFVINTNTSNTRYLRIYNASSADENASPVFTIVLLPQEHVIYDVFLNLSTACCIRGTGGSIADNDTTTATTNDIVCHVTFTDQ